MLHYIPERRCTDFDTIEDVIPLYKTKITLKLDKQVKNISLVPQSTPVKFTQKKNKISFIVDKIEGHCMLSIEYEN